MLSEPTTSSVIIPTLFDLLNQHGFSNDVIEKATGITRNVVDDPHERIPMTQFLNLWKVAIKWTNNPSLPLTLREEVPTEHMHLVAHIGMTCKTLREAMEKWCNYAMLVCETDRICFHHEETCAVLTYENTSSAHQNRYIPEHHLAIAHRYGQMFTGLRKPPIQVRFEHSPTNYLKVYQAVFHCPVLFDQKDNALVMQKDVPSMEINTHNPYMKAILSKHAEFLLKHLYFGGSIIQRVKNIIVKNLSNDQFDAAFVAAQMNMHPQTLYRKLKQEKSSFKTVLQEVRQDLSKDYLKQGVSVNEITFLLGFSEPSAFQHAFSRWFGISPGKYRYSLFENK